MPSSSSEDNILVTDYNEAIQFKDWFYRALADTYNNNDNDVVPIFIVTGEFDASIWNTLDDNIITQLYDPRFVIFAACSKYIHTDNSYNCMYNLFKNTMDNPNNIKRLYSTDNRESVQWLSVGRYQSLKNCHKPFNNEPILMRHDNDINKMQAQNISKFKILLERLSMRWSNQVTDFNIYNTYIPSTNTSDVNDLVYNNYNVPYLSSRNKHLFSLKDTDFITGLYS